MFKAGPANHAYIELNDFKPPAFHNYAPTPTFQNSETYSLTNSTRSKPTSWRKKHFTGWRFGVISCACSTVLVFLINLCATIWAISTTGIHDGRGVLFEGSCERIRPMNVGIHLMINVLGTVLLSSSNYCMQCLSAPTRKELDIAHAKRVWLDIGVPSIRNLRRINVKRALAWCILGLSSFPLHLFYNSAVFSSIAAHDYKVYMVNEFFLQQGNFSTFNITRIRDTEVPFAAAVHQDYLSGKTKNLTSAECIDAYSQEFQTTHGNVLLVVNNAITARNKAQVGTIIAQTQGVTGTQEDCAGTAYEWMVPNSYYYDGCNAPTALPRIKKDPNTWKPLGEIVEFCISQSVVEHCKLQFSVQIAILVIVLNLIKCVVMGWLAFGVKESPVMTIGDAVSTYLQRPDPSTVDMCLLSKKEVLKQGRDWRAMMIAKPYNPNPRRWFSAASVTRWALCILMYFFALAVSFGLLIYGIYNMTGVGKDFASLWALGVGATTPSTFIHGWDVPSAGAAGVIQNVIIANLAQPILSFLYFTLNGLYTCMLLSNEWSKYAVRRKGLRVSAIPIGTQRTSYTLQLPYKFALPLMVVSGVLHWLVSQSIFLVSVDVYGFDGLMDSGTSYMTCGYSPIAIIGVITAGIILVSTTIGIGFKRFRTGMPVASSCSAAISAACHASFGRDEQDAAFEGVQWGVTGSGAGGIGHCSFSKYAVEQPIHGHLYARVSEGFVIRDERRQDSVTQRHNVSYTSLHRT